MKKLKIGIEGTTGLLMHSCKAMKRAEGVGGRMAKTEILSPEKEAESYTYRDKDGFLFIPNRSIKAMILHVSARWKTGKQAVKPLVAGNTRVLPEEILIKDDNGHPIKTYEIDIRSVVLRGKDRILRARPYIKNWKAEFELYYDEIIFPRSEVFRNIIEDAGNKCGLMDNRPQRYGENGMFKVTNFDEVEA